MSKKNLILHPDAKASLVFSPTPSWVWMRSISSKMESRVLSPLADPDDGNKKVRIIWFSIPRENSDEVHMSLNAHFG
jgi:hypothetical protein